MIENLVRSTAKLFPTFKSDAFLFLEDSFPKFSEPFILLIGVFQPGNVIFSLVKFLPVDAPVAPPIGEVDVEVILGGEKD